MDGGGGWQVFRKVTLPLLLIAVAPLMIASFAFNFNNFNNIYLLTAGGPAMNEGSVAGSTDILISYTYKLAIATGKGQDFGLAAAITIIIFLIVATISAIAILEDKSSGESRVSTVDQVAEVSAPRVARKPKKSRPKFKDTWWRHLVGIAALLFALFPVVYIISAAFNATPTLTGSRLIPRQVTLDNFRQLFSHRGLRVEQLRGRSLPALAGQLHHRRRQRRAS